MTIEARDQVLAAVVQDIKDYPAVRIRYGMHFADAVILDDQGDTTADLSRISLRKADAASY
jgi:inward rectifier potassium channel